MFPTDLSSFLQLLEQADQLARVPVTVDPHLELATIVDQVSKGAGQGRALLFEQVKGSALPVATHLFGTLERVGWALGTTDLTGMAERFSRDLLAVGEPSAEQALRALTQAPRGNRSLLVSRSGTRSTTAPVGSICSRRSRPGRGMAGLT